MLRGTRKQIESKTQCYHILRYKLSKNMQTSAIPAVHAVGFLRVESKGATSLPTGEITFWMVPQHRDPILAKGKRRRIKDSNTI
jgi:hypothetical protein